MATPKRADRARRVQLLARAAGLAALGREKPLEKAFRDARGGGVPLKALRETLLQVFLFAGFPRTVNALDALERSFGPLRPEPPEPLPTGPARRNFLRRRGRMLFERVYGDDSRPVLDRIGRQHLEFRDWIVVDAYGKVLGRPGLPASERECIAVALLAVLDLPRQQVPHLRGALRCGATVEEVEAALRGVKGLASPKALAFARKRLNGH